jgi:putative ABC transport system permease protein
MISDLRFAFRLLIKNPVFSLIAIVTLTLGIGANTAIFALVNGVLLHPLPFPHPNQIVYFEGYNRAQGITDSNISFPDYLDWSKQTDLFASTAAYYNANSNLSADGAEPERVPRAGVTAGFFDVLGVQPVRGRAFLPEDDQPDAGSVAIISDGLWKNRFGSDPNIVGKKIMVSARPVTVIGVMARGFEYPERTQIWLPSGLVANEEPRDNRSMSAIARLRPGVDIARAQAQINAINARLAQQFPDTSKGWDARVRGLQSYLVRDVRSALLAVLGAVGFVLLIACTNVANLLLTRAAARQKEIAIRAAMGASRARVVRQLLIESLLLSAIGGVCGMLLSFWLKDVLLAMIPEGAPRLETVRIDYIVLAFVVAISVLTGIVFGLLPALQASKLDVSSALKLGGRFGDAHHRANVRSLLLIGEVALSLVLLIGAGLLIKSFVRLQEVRPGFNPHHVLIASIALPGAKYKEAQRPEFFRELKQRLESLPGVQTVGGGVNLPLAASNYSIGRAFIPEGRPLTANESQAASYSTITGDYFRALTIPLLAGRLFDDRDHAGAAKVAIVNELLAKRFFGSPGGAIGRRINIWRDEKFAREIVGVVGDTKPSTLDQETGEQIYVPHAQDESWNFMALVIRTASDPSSLAAAVRQEVQAIDRDQAVYNVRTMDDVVRNSLGTHRVSMQLFTVFAIVALLLAAIGIYGVMAYSVTQRTAEIGLRMALGAQRSDVLRLIVRQGLSLTLIGVAAGVVGALALTRVISNLLFHINATDPATFVAVVFFLIVVALVACWLPARRAARTDPMTALRTA